MTDDPKKEPPLSEHMFKFAIVILVTVVGLLALRYLGVR